MKRLLKELISSQITNKVSHTKLWSNIALALSTVIVAYQGLIANNLTFDIFALYLAVAVSGTTVSKIIDVNQQKATNKKQGVDNAKQDIEGE